MGDAQVGSQDPRGCGVLGRRYVSRRFLPDLSLQNVMTLSRSRTPGENSIADCEVHPLFIQLLRVGCNVQQAARDARDALEDCKYTLKEEY